VVEASHSAWRAATPPQLKEVSLLSLDLGLLQAGASMKGEFEQRLRQVIDEVQPAKADHPVHRRVHTLVGAGGPPAPATRPTC
jgi:type VI secretion system protein VasG